MTKINSILLIDDDKVINLVHHLLIKKVGVCEHIIIKDSAIDALSWLLNESNTKPDIILLDLNMPIMNGWEFLETYKKSPLLTALNIPIIILTSSTNPYDGIRAKSKKEISEYCLKPLTQDHLVSLFKKHLSLD